MNVGRRFLVEKSKSGRATCQVCNNRIHEQVPRIASLMQNDGWKMPRWHHLDCFFEVHYPKSIQEFDNFDKMDLEVQESIKQNIHWNNLGRGASPSSSSSSSS